jgi:hypothetical protein
VYQFTLDLSGFLQFLLCGLQRTLPDRDNEVLILEINPSSEVLNGLVHITFEICT